MSYGDVLSIFGTDRTTCANISCLQMISERQGYSGLIHIWLNIKTLESRVVLMCALLEKRAVSGWKID